jgi:hypothetical protein
MFPFKLPNSLDLSRKRKLILSTGSLAFSVFFYSLAIASASDSFDDVIFLKQPKVLILTSDVVTALELAKLEAQKQNVQSKQMARYAVFLDVDTFLVSLAPPYTGGLDGPEFRVEIRRSDLKVLSVVNKLGVE